MNSTVIPILVVDDDQHDLMILKEPLQEIRYASQVKNFTGDCLFHYLRQLQRSLHAALVVLDNSMPKTDGSDILFIAE